MMKKLLNLLAATPLFAIAHAALAQNLPAKFDPARDAAADVATATAAAKAQRKRVLVDVGGEWCPWCHILDRFVAANADVKKLVDDNYVWVKGYPHLFVLDGEGALVHSQDTGAWEAGKDYDKDKVLAFLRQSH